MATLTPTLTLVSADATTDALSISVTDSLSVTAPSIGISRVTVATDAATQLLADTSSDGAAYLYIKNMDTTNHVVLKNDAGNTFGRLSAEEFAFVPVETNEGCEVQASGSPCVVEYAYWTKQ